MSIISGRKRNELREVIIEPNVNKYAEGSCLITWGNTKVLCTASVDEKLPPFLKNAGKGGWVTAEYSMLPRSTQDRIQRDISVGKPNSRGTEIQRLIGRSLRACMDMKALGDRQIIIDCDVLQADGGTRCASITGGFVALYLAMEKLVEMHKIFANPIKDTVAAISCGIINGEAMLDLDYAEDSNAWTDSNFVITGKGGLVEIQGTAEHNPFSQEELLTLLGLAQKGCDELKTMQKTLLRLKD